MQLQTLRAEFAELTATAPVVGVVYRWQIACSNAAAHLFAASRELASNGNSSPKIAGLLVRARAAITQMRGLAVWRDLTRYGG